MLTCRLNPSIRQLGKQISKNEIVNHATKRVWNVDYHEKSNGFREIDLMPGGIDVLCRIASDGVDRGYDLQPPV